METTKLYVEYIVVGMETLAIIFLVIFIIIGNAFLPIIKYLLKKTMKLENSYLNKGDVKSSEKASSQS